MYFQNEPQVDTLMYTREITHVMENYTCDVINCVHIKHNFSSKSMNSTSVQNGKTQII